MKGKKNFSTDEIKTLRELVYQYQISNSASERKSIRTRFRKKGFYMSDFNIRDITIEKFDSIFTLAKNLNSNKLQNTRIKKNTNVKTEKDPFRTLNSDNNYKKYDKLNYSILNKTGFYVIRLEKKSNLSNKYQSYVDERNNRILYVGKAQGQSLKKRLGQEIEHKSPGTFFRSIGCVLGFKPIKGHLKDKANKNNYKFSISDTLKIIDWLKTNTQISIVEFVGNFKVEKELILKFKPLLNNTHNPYKLKELINDRKECRKIANS